MTALNDYRLIATQVDRIFNCGRSTSLGACVLPAEHSDPCQGMPPVIALCQQCRGRGQIPGTTWLCWTCLGSGVAE